MREELPAPLVIEGLKNIVRGHEEVLRHHFAGGLVGRVGAVLQHYQNIAANHLNGVERFKEDVVRYLRAFVLLLEMVGGAATHHEKGVLLRHLVGQVETAIGQIQKAKVEMAYSHWSPPDLWRSDYPVREYLRRIHELERQAGERKEERDQLLGRLAKLEAERSPPRPAEEAPASLREALDRDAPEQVAHNGPPVADMASASGPEDDDF